MTRVRTWVMAALIGCGGGAVGCGGGDGGSGGGLVSCTVSETISFGTEPAMSIMICEEATGLSAQQRQQLQQTCSTQTGGAPDAGVTIQSQFRNGGCSHTGALGGCLVMSGGASITAWYYQNGLSTPDDIRMLCSLAGAQYVAP